MNYYNRLRELRGDKSQAKFAEPLGLSQQNYGNYERGEQRINSDLLTKICKVYKCTPEWLLGLDNVKTYVIPEMQFIEVPLYGSIAAGTPIEMIDADDIFPIPAKMHEKYPDAFLLKVVGSSMNRILPDGCYALVDPCDDIERDNQPHAVCVNGYDATIKRVHKLANGFELVPDSTDPTYKPKVYDYGEQGTEEITVIGRVVYHVLPFDWSY